MRGSTKQGRVKAGGCTHCGDDSGVCVSLRCAKCGELLCSRSVTPVLPESPYYPNKHRTRGSYCGPVQPLLLAEG